MVMVEAVVVRCAYAPESDRWGTYSGRIAAMGMTVHLMQGRFELINSPNRTNLQS